MTEEDEALRLFAQRMGVVPTRLDEEIPPEFHEMARLAGVDIDRLRELDTHVQAGWMASMRATALLPPLGWAVTPANVLTIDDYIAVVQLIDDGGDSEAVDNLMTDA